jgi:hypothetical protein
MKPPGEADRRAAQAKREAANREAAARTRAARYAEQESNRVRLATIAADPVAAVRRNEVEPKEIEAARKQAVAELRAKLAALKAVDDGRHPPGFVEAQRRPLLAEWERVNGQARQAYGEWAATRARDAERRQAEGTPLTEADLAEAALIVRQWEGRTQTEQRLHVAQEAARLARLGANDKARRFHRAAEALGVADSEAAQLLAAADPVRRKARIELETYAEAGAALERRILEERGAEGLLSAGESVRLKVAQAAAAGD